MRTEHRTAARGLLVSPDGRVLLIHTDLPWLGLVWMVPGGGVESDESLHEAVTRELREETGIDAPRIGPELWRRTVNIELADRRIALREHYFLVSVSEFVPSGQQLSADEQVWFRGYRWWAASEIESSVERFAPPELAALLSQLVAGGPSSRVIELGQRAHRSSSA